MHLEELQSFAILLSNLTTGFVANPLLSDTFILNAAFLAFVLFMSNSPFCLILTVYTGTL